MIKDTTYYQTDDGKVFRYNPKTCVYLLCTPSKEVTDRRFTEIGKAEAVSKQRAMNEISKQWKAFDSKWEWNGKKYVSRGMIYTGKSQYVSSISGVQRTQYDNLFNMCPEHQFKHSYEKTDSKGCKVNVEYTDTYYLVSYHGKLVWTQMSQYIPRLYYYKFESIDKEPFEFSGWTSVGCVKPVYCLTDKKYI